MNKKSRKHISFKESEIRDAVAVFKSLSDPTRLKIISVLIKDSNICVSDIAEVLGMSVSRVSHHLGILEKLGFAEQRQEGKQVYYTIHDDCIVDIMARVQEHVRGK